MPKDKKFYQRYSQHLKGHCKKEEKIYDALRDLVPFLEFKKRKRHLWRSVK